MFILYKRKITRNPANFSEWSEREKQEHWDKLERQEKGREYQRRRNEKEPGIGLLDNDGW